MCRASLSARRTWMLLRGRLSSNLSFRPPAPPGQNVSCTPGCSLLLFDKPIVRHYNRCIKVSCSSIQFKVRATLTADVVAAVDSNSRSVRSLPLGSTINDLRRADIPVMHCTSQSLSPLSALLLWMDGKPMPKRGSEASYDRSWAFYLRGHDK